MSKEMTLNQARKMLGEIMETGKITTCPCCEQKVKVYRRKLNENIAFGVIALYKHSGQRYAHIPTVLGHQATEETKGWWWGLMERQPGLRDDGSNRTGWWRVTDKGVLWVTGQISVPEYAIVYNNECYGLEGNPWYPQNALGKKFNYRELMDA